MIQSLAVRISRRYPNSAFHHHLRVLDKHRIGEGRFQVSRIRPGLGYDIEERTIFPRNWIAELETMFVVFIKP